MSSYWPYAPCYAVDLWDISRLEYRVGNATEGGSNIKSEDQGAPAATVWLSRVHYNLSRVDRGLGKQVEEEGDKMAVKSEEDLIRRSQVWSSLQNGQHEA
jgi:hypothetical protein